MTSMDDDKLEKYRNQVKQRKLCRAVILVALLMATAGTGFVFLGSDSELVTTAAKYHPKVKDIHHRLNEAAHRHLNKAHVHLKNHHWRLPNAPYVSSKLRGTASSLIHMHHTMTQDKQEPMATQSVKEQVASDTHKE